MRHENLLASLPLKERKGSRARCVLMTEGPRSTVAARLTSLAKPHAVVSAEDVWAPVGFEDPAEALLARSPRFLSTSQHEELSRWWLAVRPRTARVPTWDIVATATIGTRPGLLLVEAKGHPRELANEAAAKRSPPSSSAGSGHNHEAIGRCIEQASRALSRATRSSWKLSRDSHYQMANRFAWAWKVASLGVPVVLVYLGFVAADEMPSVIADDLAWTKLVLDHGRGRVPESCWNATIDVRGTPLVPLIRTHQVPLPKSATTCDAPSHVRTP